MGERVPGFIDYVALLKEHRRLLFSAWCVGPGGGAVQHLPGEASVAPSAWLSRAWALIWRVLVGF